MQTDIHSNRGADFGRNQNSSFGQLRQQGQQGRQDDQTSEGRGPNAQQQDAQEAARTFAEAQSEFTQACSDLIQGFSRRSQELSSRNVDLLNEVVQSRGFGEMQSILQRWMSENAQRNSAEVSQAFQRWNGLAGHWMRVSSRQFIAPFDQIQQIMTQSIQSLREQTEQIAQAAENLSDQAERTIEEGIRQAQENSDRIANQAQDNAQRFGQQAQDNAQRFGQQAQDNAQRTAQQGQQAAEGKAAPGGEGKTGKPDDAASARGKQGGKGLESTAGQAD
jgi:hypothetical protein